MQQPARVLVAACVVMLTAPLAACSGTAADGALSVRPAAARAADTAPSSSPARAPQGRVLAISIDALNPRALTKLGRDRLPHFWRLLDEGAATLNARTQLEMTVTLPNHTSMVTGRPIDAGNGGHGVDWNDDAPGTTVQRAAGRPVSSVFNVVHAAGGSTALFSTKTKFSLFDRSWDDAVDRSTVMEEQDARLVRAARQDLLRSDRAFTFLHLGIADQTGHAHGFMGPAYLRAVDTADALVGTLLDAIDTHPALDDVVVVLTADHGGQGTGHIDATRLADYRVPFVAWGPGVATGDLYAMNPAYVEPGRGRPDLVGPQPVRNGDLANLVTDLLGLRPVPGSLFGRRQALDVAG